MYMIRKQLYIDERHERLLKRRAVEQGLSEAELVRRALDSLLSEVEGSSAAPRARVKALEEFLGRADEAVRDIPEHDWRFDREELYAEREARAAR